MFWLVSVVQIQEVNHDQCIGQHSSPFGFLCARAISSPTVFIGSIAMFFEVNDLSIVWASYWSGSGKVVRSFLASNLATCMHLTTTHWLLWIQPTLRQAAVATLRHLSERDPVCWDAKSLQCFLIHAWKIASGTQCLVVHHASENYDEDPMEEEILLCNSWLSWSGGLHPCLYVQVSLVVEQIEEDLFAMLDNETDERWSATLLTLYASLGLALHFR